MLDKIKFYSEEISAFAIKNKQDLEYFRLKYLSKKGILNELFEKVCDDEVSNNREVLLKKIQNYKA